MSLITKLLCFASLIAVVAGCTHNVSNYIAPEAKFDSIKKVHVTLNPKEMGWETPPYIKSDMESLGYKATVGFEKDAPQDADVILVVYEAWAWDMTPFIATSKLTVKDAKTGTTMGYAQTNSTSFGRKSAKDIAKEMVDQLFQKPAAK